MANQGWNPYQSVIVPNGEIQFELIDVDAADVAQVLSDTESAPFTNLSQTHDRITNNSKKLATLEKNLWKLDGTFEIPSKWEHNGECGWWSEPISDENGAFSTIPHLTYLFDTPQASNGFTLVFDTKAKEILSDFTITTYLDDEMINSVSVTNNTDDIRVVNCPSHGYNKLVIALEKTRNPNRRARLTEVVFGYLQRFDKQKIVDMKLTEETSLYMQSLPSKSLSVTIDNSDKAYNVLNPTGIYRFLQQGQGINAQLSLNGESVSMGRFYFNNAQANDDALTATINAYDLIYRMDQATFDWGTSGTWTILEAVQTILSVYDNTISINIPSEIGNRIIGKCIPKGTLIREALRLTAQAAKTHLYINRLDELTARDLSPIDSQDSLHKDNMLSWGKAKDTGLINCVEIKVQDEFSSNDEITYTATNQQLGETLGLLRIYNPLVLDSSVAEWMLSLLGNRNQYELTAMSNPVRQIGDGIQISDLYGGENYAIVTKQQFCYDGSLLSTITAYGGNNQ